MLVRFVIRLIKLYQITISRWRPSSCRFYPSCSEYCIESVSRFGLLKGLWKAVIRLCKCHPFHPGGIDFVH